MDTIAPTTSHTTVSAVTALNTTHQATVRSRAAPLPRGPGVSEGSVASPVTTEPLPTGPTGPVLIDPVRPIVPVMPRIPARPAG